MAKIKGKKPRSDRFVPRSVAAVRLNISEETLRKSREFQDLPASAIKMVDRRMFVDFELLEASWGVTHPDYDAESELARSGALERLRIIQGDIAEQTLSQRIGELVEINEMEQRISVLANLLRQAVLELQTQYGEKAGDIVLRVLDAWGEQMETWQPEHRPD